MTASSSPKLDSRYRSLPPTRSTQGRAHPLRVRRPFRASLVDFWTLPVYTELNRSSIKKRHGHIHHLHASLGSELPPAPRMLRSTQSKAIHPEGQHNMIAAGLLWYDDDVRRPLAIKLAEAAERYRERVGFEPTTCLLNPAQIPSAPPATGRGSRKKIVVPAITLRLVSDEHLRPNYFFVGVGEGERPKRVRGWRGGFDEDQKDALPTRRARRVSGKAAEPARTSAPPKLAAPVTSGAPAKSTKATAAPKPAEAPRPASAIPATPTLAAQTAKKAHSRPVVAAPSSRSPEIAEAAPLRRRRAAPAADSAVPAAAPATVPAGRAARAVGSVGGSTETAA